MKRSNLEKLKRDFDGQPDLLRTAVDAASVELDELQAKGITKGNQQRAEWLLDMLDFSATPTGAPEFLPQPYGVGSADPATFDLRFGEYLQAVVCGTPGVDAGRKLGRFETGTLYREVLERERRSTGMEESTPSLGGFAVSTDFSTELFTKAHAASKLYSKTRQFTISTRANGLKIPGIDEVSRADGSRGGGIRSYWLHEGGTKTASKPTLMMVELSFKRLIGLCYATDELLDDAAVLGQVIRTGFADEISFRLDDAILNGSGAGEPLGVLNSPACVEVAGITSAASIISTEVINMWGRLFPASEGSAEWYVNKNCLPLLMQMHGGSFGGEGMFWLPASQVAGRPFQTLFGKPVNIIEQANSVGTKGDILLMDLSQYATISKAGLQVASSIHIAYVTDETCFRFVFRVDGQPLWNNVLTPFKGSSTQSPFIALGTRT